jgi:hypothetical protein
LEVTDVDHQEGIAVANFLALGVVVQWRHSRLDEVFAQEIIEHATFAVMRDLRVRVAGKVATSILGIYPSEL